MSQRLGIFVAVTTGIAAVAAVALLALALLIVANTGPVAGWYGYAPAAHERHGPTRVYRYHGSHEDAPAQSGAGTEVEQLRSKVDKLRIDLDNLDLEIEDVLLADLRDLSKEIDALERTLDDPDLKWAIVEVVRLGKITDELDFITEKLEQIIEDHGDRIDWLEHPEESPATTPKEPARAAPAPPEP